MATARWLGKAKKVRQVDTVTISGTWSAGDTITLTVDGVAFVVTIGSLTTTAQVATTLKEAYNGETLTDTSASCSPTVSDGGAVSLGQFAEMAASVVSSTVTLTGATAGKPVTMTCSDTAASGTATLANVTAATGCHHFNNAANWSTGSVPVDGDTIIIDTGSIDIKYGLSTGINPAAVIRTMGYTGRIGLADTNIDNSAKPYPEYRTKSLTFTSNSTALTATIGDGFGAGSQLTRIDFGDCATTLNVNGTGPSFINGQPALLVLGSAISSANLRGGFTGIAWYDGETATVTSVRVGNGASVVIGAGASLTNVDINDNATAVIRSNTTSLKITGGVVDIERTSAHTLIAASVSGTVNYRSSGTITTLQVGAGGTFDRDGDERAFTITNAVQMYTNASFVDTHGVGTYSGGFVFNRCRVQDTKFDVGAHRTITVA